MRALKKAAAALLAVCLMVPMFSLVAIAADGRLMFSDPQTKVGENVSIDLVVQSQGNTIGDVSVTMNYSTDDLEFVNAQQAMADKLGISLRYYQQIEAGDRTGDFNIWDTLEDLTGIHQRILRETDPGKADSP